MLLQTFKIHGTVWTTFFINDKYFINKNGKPWNNGNGPEFETESEAEVNILNEYRKLNN